MALSDCEQCWDTPCTCGWQYRVELRKLADRLLQLKRYDTDIMGDGEFSYENITESKTGVWVEWDDIQPIVDQLKKGMWGG